jgi:hypothetical protein
MSHTLLRCFVLLAGLSRVGIGCRSPETHTEPPAEWAESDREASPALDFYGPRGDSLPQRVFGASILVREFSSPCRLETTWQVNAKPTQEFLVTLVADKGSVFPMPEHMVSLGGCIPKGTDELGRVFPPFAILELRPPAYFDWAAPKPGNVYIPLQGEAILDGDYHATAMLDARDDARSGELSVTVATTSPAKANEDYPHLRPRDSFRWGRSEATVVRVIEPIAKAVGWVEIELSTPDAKHVAGAL